MPDAAAAGARALHEDVDVARLVGELRGEEHRDLGVGGVDARQEARRHVERRQLVLGEEGHHLTDGALERGGQRRARVCHGMSRDASHCDATA